MKNVHALICCLAPRSLEGDGAKAPPKADLAGKRLASPTPVDVAVDARPAGTPGPRAWAAINADAMLPLPQKMGVYPNAQPQPRPSFEAAAQAGGTKPPATLPTLLVGESGARYLRGQRLASGGFGKVYPAVREDGEVFAVKIYRLGGRQALSSFYNGQPMDKPRLTHVSSLAAIEAENATLAAIGAFMRPLDQGSGAGRYFVILPMMACSLAAITKEALGSTVRREEQVRRLALTALVTGGLALSVGEGQHFVHRDIKPENFMVAEDGSMHLGDWGLARRLGPDEEEVEGGSGTRGFQPPEVTLAHASSKTSDSYSLALTVAEVCSGKNPLRRSFYAPLRAERVDLQIRQLTLSQWIVAAPRSPEGDIDFTELAQRRAQALAGPDTHEDAGVALRLDSWALEINQILGPADTSHLLGRMLAFHADEREAPGQIAMRYMRHLGSPAMRAGLQELVAAHRARNPDGQAGIAHLKNLWHALSAAGWADAL